MDNNIKESIRRFIPIAISAFTVVVTFLIQFTVFSINSEFSWSEFLPQFAVNMFLLVTTAILWLNSGTYRAKNDKKSAYKDNSALYATKIKEVTDGGQLGDLRAFCKSKTDEMLQSKITTILANVGIDRKHYDATLKSLSAVQLKEDGYSKRQIKAIERVRNGRVRVRPIRYMDLLSDSSANDDYGVNYNERADKAVRITFRVVRAAVMTLVFALIGIDLVRDIRNFAAWVMFFMRLFTIVWTAYSSEHEGYARISETKNKVILRRIAFLHEFDEWASVPRLKVGENHESR